jgi:hypothetical protein
VAAVGKQLGGHALLSREQLTQERAVVMVAHLEILVVGQAVLAQVDILVQGVAAVQELVAAELLLRALEAAAVAALITL